MKKSIHINVGDLRTDKLIKEGVSKLKNFGFVNVTPQNILQDEVYCFFFLRFIDTIKGENKELDSRIETLVKGIERK